jgi:hypothetical protein
MVHGIGITLPVLAKSGFRFSFMNNIISQQNCELLFYCFLVWEGSGRFGHVWADYCVILQFIAYKIACGTKKSTQKNGTISLNQ